MRHSGSPLCFDTDGADITAQRTANELIRAVPLNHRG